jgi:hypothetical protein
MPELEFAQRGDLQLLYQAWQGGQWLQADGWLSEKHHCDWAGVSCCNNTTGTTQPPAWRDEERWRLADLPSCFCCCNPGAVVALQLPANNVVGNFSVLTEQGNSSLASTLLYINLAGNGELAGSISAGIGAFQQLQGLFASSCSLRGRLPDALSNLPNLTTLDLSNNTLSGSIPPGLWQAQRLRILQLDSNRLSGSIALQELLLMPALQRFSARENRLSGPLLMPNTSLLQALQTDRAATRALGAISATWHATLDDLDLRGNSVRVCAVPSSVSCQSACSE